MMDELEARFEPFLRANLPTNPLKCEYFLPYVRLLDPRRQGQRESA